MELKNKFAEMNDDSLHQVVGGYLVVSKWRAYVLETVYPAINQMALSASDSDKAILNSVYSVFLSTLIPEAAIAQPIQNLWDSFNLDYRNRLESQDIKDRLGAVLSDARIYIAQNA